MRSIISALSERLKAQSTDLLNLVEAIDLHVQIQRTHRDRYEKPPFIAHHTLFDMGAVPVEDYSDLLPNPPRDQSAWRGAQFRWFRNFSVPETPKITTDGRSFREQFPIL